MSVEETTVRVAPGSGIPARRSKWSTVDRVTAIEPGKSARGIRNVPNTLSIFDSHFPRFPVLPGVLILGSMAELARLLLEKETSLSWGLAGVEQIRFRRFVQPGDQMEVLVDIKSFSPEEAILTASARVDGKPVTTVRQLRMVPSIAGGTG